MNFHRRFLPGALNVSAPPLRCTPEIIGVEFALRTGVTAAAVTAEKRGDDARLERRKSDLREGSSLMLSARRQMPRSCKIMSRSTAHHEASYLKINFTAPMTRHIISTAHKFIEAQVASLT